MGAKQKSIFEEDMDKLRSKLNRLERRRLEGKTAADFVSVDVYFLEDLLNEIDELRRKS